MKLIARLSQVAVASTVLALPMTGHADLVGWSGWTHQVYAGGGLGVQYINNKTRINNAVNSATYLPLGFNNHRAASVSNLDVGLANSMGKNYWGVEFNAVNTTADNSAYYNGAVGYAANYYTYTANMPWRYELDGIMGYYVQPNILAYGKLGGTMGRLNTLYTQAGVPNVAGGSTIALNKILYGVVVGGGSQYVVNQHWRVGAEADFVQFFNGHKTDSNYIYDTAVVPADLNYQIKQWNFVAKATVNYLF
ncbi:MAG: hypothetical protein K0R66_721 [Gammaproteobacteria bacterium]|jgi:hypothetical protein|nr:hypothetical protein [Gammaproteobacteria bacterium]